MKKCHWDVRTLIVLYKRCIGTEQPAYLKCCTCVQ